MKVMKVSDLKNLLSAVGMKDEDLITKRFITKVFKSFGDDYELASYICGPERYKELTLLENNKFKEVMIRGESK